MKQEEFNQVKEWVEKNTGLEFFDSQALFDEDGAYFDKAIDIDRRVTLCVNNDRSAEIWMHFTDDSAIEIYASDSQNSHVCMSVFEHIVRYN